MAKPERNKRRGPAKEKSEYDQFILDLARVTRVTRGGKHLSFRVCIVLGNRKGKVGYGVAKGADVQLGVEKAVRQAKKRMLEVKTINGTIPHAIVKKYKAASVILKPAPAGAGIIAGGAARVIFELAGVPNISAKILGKTKNKISVVKATFAALESFKKGDKKANKPVANKSNTDQTAKEEK